MLREEGAGLESGEAGGERLRAHPDEAITNLNVLFIFCAAFVETSSFAEVGSTIPHCFGPAPFMKAASESLLAGFTHAVIEYSLLITK
jgi:hypothetical protein